jgi:anti-anti-sigma factor
MVERPTGVKFSVMPPPMDIVDRVAGDVTVLDLVGRFVDDREEIFRETMNRLVREGRRKVLLNFDGVTYMDSAGLGMLVSRYIRLTKFDGQLKLCNLHRRSFRVLDITNLLTVFDSYESERLALLSFRDAEDQKIARF